MFLRVIFKNFLQYLSQVVIKKHSIEFVVVVGWYGTDLVREGIYKLLEEKKDIRRNQNKIWWDFSIPLLILGFEDKRYNIFEWIWIVCKTVVLLFVSKKNPHLLVVDLNLADRNTAEFWSKMIIPKLLIVTSYKPKESFIIHKLVRKAKAYENKIIFSEEIKIKEFKQYPKYPVGSSSREEINIENDIFSVNKKLSLIQIQVYSAIIASAKALDLTKDEILNQLAKFDILEFIVKKLKI